MEQAIDTSHGVTVLIACLVIGLAVNALVWIFFLYKKKFDESIDEIKQSNEKLGESFERLRSVMSSNIETTIRLDHSMKSMNETLKDLPQIKEHLRRSFIAVRLLAKDDWDKIKAEIFEDLPKGSG